MSELDNPIWSSLTSVFARFAEGSGKARRFPPAVTSLAAVSEETREAFADLANTLSPGERCGLFLNLNHEVPESFDLFFKSELFQMECKKLLSFPAIDFLELSKEDVPDMVQLAKMTEPGPFGTRTIEMENYIGMRNQAGELIAMTGQRCQSNTFIEISAVCVHPDYRGKGLAKALVSEVCQRILAANKTPCLHVLPSNESAIKSYRALGFEVRRSFHLLSIKRRDN
jgi:ribosomal protein S18 acetylase RimI-like enzyme